MMAPDISYNDTKGVYPVFRLFGYPTPDRRYSVTLGKSTTKDENYELEFSDRGLWDTARRSWPRTSSTSATRRSASSASATSRTRTGSRTTPATTTRALGSVGVWILPYVNVDYEMRIERYSIGRGQVDNIPFIQTEFPGMTAEDRFDATFYWAHRTSIAYDTRDSYDIRRRARTPQLYVEGASPFLGSSTWFVKFGVNWRQFIPLGTATRSSRCARSPTTWTRATTRRSGS
jgi:hypothetical protein